MLTLFTALLGAKTSLLEMGVQANQRYWQHLTSSNLEQLLQVCAAMVAGGDADVNAKRLAVLATVKRNGNYDSYVSNVALPQEAIPLQVSLVGTTDCPGLCQAPPGYQVTTSDSNLEICPSNTYNDGSLTQCQTCPSVSTYTSLTGSTSIQDCTCQPGYFGTSPRARGTPSDCTAARPSAPAAPRRRPAPMWDPQGVSSSAGEELLETRGRSC